MNINELPEEILVRILSFLPRSDRLESALTCRRWAQIIARAPPLLRDIWLVIEENRIEEARTVLANSQRQYENLRYIDEYSLKFNAAFWASVGPGLRKLKLMGCGPSLKRFYYILQACSNLESLKMSEPLQEVFNYKVLRADAKIFLAGIQESTRNLRHLDVNFCVGADYLEYLLILMPNVPSIALSDVYMKSDFLSRLPNMLGTSRNITSLGLSAHSFDEDFDSDKCEQLLRISSASLRTFVYSGEISASTALDELRNCTMLRNLCLSLLDPCDTRLLHNILRNVPELESLLIDNRSLETPFKREDLTPIFDLRRLRKLKLEVKLETPACTPVPNEIVVGLLRMVSLESLTLGDELGIVDSSRFRILAGMPNLRKLRMYSFAWDSECLRVVLFDIGKLKTLRIRGFGSSTHDVSALRDWQQIPQDRQAERKLSSLEVLEIDDIPLSDASLGRIVASHSRLRIIKLSVCKYITDAGLLTLFQLEPLLEKLTLCQVHCLNGTFLEGLGELCRRLRSLTVIQKFDTRSKAVKELKLRRPRVYWNLY